MQSGRRLVKLHPWTVHLLAVLAICAGVMLILQAIPATESALQKVDNETLEVARSNRVPPLTVIALALNIIGGAWITIPLRVIVTVLLVMRRRWSSLGAFLVAVGLAEALTAIIKLSYGRPRPPESLVLTTGYSFPSGHTLTTAVVAVMIVFLFVHPGPRRQTAMIAAIAFTLIMGVSRVYLAAHWLSDAVASALLGNTIALGSALLIQVLHDRRRGITERERDRGPLEQAALEHESEAV
jgi:undecaprenyl-diphosphatase